FGEEYAEEGTQTLRLLALSAIPAMVTSLYVAVWRAERRLGLLAAVRVVQFGIVAIVSLALIEPFGIVGPAVTWLVVQRIAAVVLVFFWPRVLLGHGDHPPRRLRFLFGLRTAAAKTGILAAWQWALGGRSSRRLRAGLERL